MVPKLAGTLALSHYVPSFDTRWYSLANSVSATDYPHAVKHGLMFMFVRHGTCPRHKRVLNRLYHIGWSPPPPPPPVKLCFFLWHQMVLTSEQYTRRQCYLAPANELCTCHRHKVMSAIRLSTHCWQAAYMLSKCIPVSEHICIPMSEHCGTWYPLANTMVPNTEHCGTH